MATLGRVVVASALAALAIGNCLATFSYGAVMAGALGPSETDQLELTAILVATLFAGGGLTALLVVASARVMRRPARAIPGE